MLRRGLVLLLLLLLLLLLSYYSYSYFGRERERESPDCSFGGEDRTTHFSAESMNNYFWAEFAYRDQSEREHSVRDMSSALNLTSPHLTRTTAGDSGVEYE